MSKRRDASDELTRAVFSQVLVFTLLFLSKWAAGLTALSGLAFTRHPPTVWKKDKGVLDWNIFAQLYADVIHSVMSIFSN